MYIDSWEQRLLLFSSSTVATTLAAPDGRCASGCWPQSNLTKFESQIKSNDSDVVNIGTGSI